MTQRAIIWCAVSSKRQLKEVSLGEQERLARVWCEERGVEVVDVLSVPGHSRRESDILTLFDDYARKGIRAYHDLRQHWKQKDFEILIAYDDSRFGRSSTLPSFVMENTILCGAKIEYLIGGTVEKGDGYRFRIAYGSANAASEVDKFTERARTSKDAKAAQGKLFNSSPPYSHRYIRNSLGRLVEKVVDETHQQVIRDAARLVIERVGWDHVEAELYSRFGHTKNGNPFPRNFFYHLFHNPVFYGHDVRRWRQWSPNGQSTGIWVFDETVPAPDGVLIYYNVHQPAITGNLMIELKSELRRRRLASGGTRGHRTHVFSGLLICAECGHLMVHSGATRPRYRCQSVYKGRGASKQCSQTRYIQGGTVEEYLTPLLQMMIDENNASFFLATPPDIEQQLANLRSEYEALEQRSKRIAEQRLDADVLQQKIYADMLRDTAAAMRSLRDDIAAAEIQAGRFDNEASDTAFEKLKTLEYAEHLWQEPPSEANHILHGLLGRRRFAVRDNQIVGMTEI